LRAVEKVALGHESVRLAEKDPPQPGPMQVLVEVCSAGVCRTDLHIIDDSYASHPPVTMGHEVSGYVREVGPGVDRAWVGARVSCETFFYTCGTCPWCSDGRPNLCPNRRSIGSGTNGGFAPLLVVNSSQLHRVAEHLGEHAGALYEPLACVCQALCDPSLVAPGDDVLVTGPGTIGLLAAQVARALGGRVLLVGVDADEVRLEKARELGFDVALATDRTAMKSMGDGFGPHVVIECSGVGPAMATGLEVVRPGGRYVQLGQTGDPVSVPLALVSFKEILVTGGFASTPKSWRRAEGLLERRLVELDPLVSEVATLEDWERVFKEVEQGRGLKHVFDPRQ
jgi:L-iditol 2-dehydrogenase